MRFALVVSAFCVWVLLNVNSCSCSEEKILGYGTKFGTILAEESKKVIGKQFTLFSMETGVKKVDLVMAINLSSVALILTKDFFQALERPRVIWAGTMRRLCWRCSRDTNCTGPWQRRRRRRAGRGSAGSPAPQAHTAPGDSASVTQVARCNE